MNDKSRRTTSRPSSNRFRNYNKKFSNHLKNGKSPLWKKILLGFITFCAVIALIFAGIGIKWISDAPEITKEDLLGSIASTIYDKDGNAVYETSQNDRIIVNSSEISQDVFDAVTSIEDQRFLKHHGIDPVRIFGSLLANLRAGGISQGASTLTQQLVKLSVFSTNSEDRTYKRKVQELWLALQVERHYSKQEIFEFYINKVYMSNGIYGMGTAAKIYYGKPLNELSLAQTALLAGMPQAPTDYDPYTHPDAAKKRRNLVLSQMLENNKITQDEYNTAVAKPINEGLLPLTKDDGNFSNQELMLDAYVQQVAQDVKDAGYDLYKDGLKVYTYLDMSQQRYISALANDDDGALFPNKKMQTAISVLDTPTSGIVAMVGGRNPETALGYNRATNLQRSVGSSIKPLTDYAPAIEYLHYSPGQTISDSPTTYSDGSQISNWDKSYQGEITLRQALAQSRNIPALKVFQAVTATRVNEFLNQLDIELNNGAGAYESNAIGGEISPLKLSAAYAAMGNKGVYTKPKATQYFTTTDGKRVDISADTNKAMKESTAYIITDMLKEVFKTGLSAGYHNGNLYEAGKTGTTNYSDEERQKYGIPNGAFPDHWSTGYTTDYTVSIWVGYDEPYSSSGYLYGTDSEISQRLYRNIMDHLESGKTVTDWTMPATVHRVNLIFGSNPLQLATRSTGGRRVITDLADQELYDKLTANVNLYDLYSSTPSSVYSSIPSSSTSSSESSSTSRQESVIEPIEGTEQSSEISSSSPPQPHVSPNGNNNNGNTSNQTNQNRAAMSSSAN